MNKTLTVTKPYGWMEPGETFELSEDGKMYTNTHTTEYNSVCKNNDITSKATTVYSISPDFAKALIEDGYLSESTDKFCNVFDTMDSMLETYHADLDNLDEDMKNLPACVKIEKETVLRNLIKTVSYLRSLKK